MIKIIITSFFLGIGLAMDACAVSMANGLKEPKMKLRKIILIAFMFGFFQALMPFIGYLVGSAFLTKISGIIPYVALILLGIVGGKMLFEGIDSKDEIDDESKSKELTFKVLIIQAIATSIDALSVGFTISDYKMIEALISVTIIAIVTFIICVGAVFIGKKFGTKLGKKAEILGGIILIAIGIEIFVSGVFF